MAVDSIQGTAILPQPQNLADGLRLRFCTREDTERVADFQQSIHHPDRQHRLIETWVRDLMSGEHPTTDASDFTIVENADGEIVSSMCLISQTWTFGGAAFPCGMPELVATAPEYRRKGLVRRQFAAIHDLSARRGELMQFIGGIPNFYRQFGYDMALNMGGGRTVRESDIPDQHGAKAAVLRRAQIGDDLAFVHRLTANAVERQSIAVQWQAGALERAMRLGPATGQVARDWLIIETPRRRRIGYVSESAWVRGDECCVLELELVPGVSHLNVMPDVLCSVLANARQKLEEGDHPSKQANAIEFWLGEEHPAYAALDPHKTRRLSPYAWYIRVPDMVAFLKRISGGLERNLLGTVAEGYTGTIAVSDYRSAFRIDLRRGKIAEIASCEPCGGNTRFPDLTLLQLVFGRRRCEELAVDYADCSVGHVESAVLDSLFPPFRGNVTPFM